MVIEIAFIIIIVIILIVGWKLKYSIKKHIEKLLMRQKKNMLKIATVARNEETSDENL